MIYDKLGKKCVAIVFLAPSAQLKSYSSYRLRHDLYMLHVTEFLLASQQESSRFQPFPFFEEGSNPNRLPLSIVVYIHICTYRTYATEPLKVRVRAVYFLVRRYRIAQEPLRFHVNANQIAIVVATIDLPVSQHRNCPARSTQ